MSHPLDAVRDVAREVSAAMVRDQLRRGIRVRTPRDPGSTYVRETFRTLLVAHDLGLIEVTIKGDA